MGGWLIGRLRRVRRLGGRMRVQEGFTLIELMVVVAVLAVLGLLAVPKLWGAVHTATRQVAVEQAQQIRSAMEMYRAEQKKYPPSPVADLDALATALESWIEIETDPDSTDKVFADTLSYDVSSNGKNYTLELFIPTVEDPDSGDQADWRKITVTPDGVSGPSTLDAATDPTTINW